MARGWLRMCLALLGLAVSCGTRAAGPALESGDLVFEASSSAQSAAIQWASASRWSHVGIVDVEGGKPGVIEALGKVSRTPWDAWSRRARRGGAYLVLRPHGLTAAQRRARTARSAGLDRPVVPHLRHVQSHGAQLLGDDGY